MASLIDAVGLLKGLGFYETVFPLLLVAAIIYGILSKYKIFGDKQIVNILVATISGLIFISFAKASAFMQFAMPMIIIFLIFWLFLQMVFLFIGVKEDTIAKALTKETAGYLIPIFIVVIIVVLSIQQAFPEFSYAAAPELAPINATAAAGTPAAAQQFAFQQAVSVIFHPTIVALSVLFLILAIGVYFITREPLGK